MAAIMPTARAIERLANRGVSLYYNGQPLNVKGRLGLALRVRGAVSAGDLAAQIRRLSRQELSHGAYELNGGRFVACPELAGLTEKHSEALRLAIRGNDPAGLLAMMSRSGPDNFIAHAVTVVDQNELLAALERLYDDPKMQTKNHHRLIRQAIAELFNAQLAGLGLKHFNLLAEIPEFARMLALPAVSASHEGISASRHTFKVLYLLGEIKAWAGGERELLSAELLGRKPAEGTETSAELKIIEYLKSLDDCDLVKYLSDLTDPKQQEAFKNMLVYYDQTEALLAYIRRLSPEEAGLLLAALRQIFQFEFMDFMSAVLLNINNTNLLVLAALLHDIGKINSQPFHTKQLALAETIGRRLAQRQGFSVSGIEIIKQVVRHHVLMGSIPLKEDNYESFAKVFDAPLDKEMLPELINILTLIGILDVAATGARGHLNSHGIHMMKLLHKNYQRFLSQELNWLEICDLMTHQGYGFGRLISFVGPASANKLSQAIEELVPREELSAFYGFISRTNHFSQFYFKLKNYQPRAAIVLFLLLARLRLAAAQNGRIINNIRLDSSQAAKIAERLSQISEEELVQNSQGAIYNFYRDRRRQTLFSVTAAGLVFEVNCDRKEISVMLDKPEGEQ